MGLQGRLAMRLALAGLALAGRLPGHARDCSVASDSPTFPGDTAAFTLVCDTAAQGKVGWDFGDGNRQDSAAGATTARHAFAAAGGYRVTAGVEGEPYGFVGRHAVVNHPTPVAPAHTNTLLYDDGRDDGRDKGRDNGRDNGRDKSRARVWCVNQDNNSISVFDPSAKARLKEIPVGRNPRTLGQDSLGRIWVANQDDATLILVDGATYAVIRTVALPRASRPYGVCFAPDGGTAYVTLEGTGKLLRLDAASLQVTGQLDLFPSPRAIAVSHDGSRILVTRYISPEYHGEIADVKAEPFSLARVIPLAYEGDPTMAGEIWGVPNGLGSIAISPDGKRAWLPFVKDNVRLGSFVTPSGGVPGFESTVRTVITQIDLAAGEEDRGSRRDFTGLSMADALAFDGIGAKAYVATPSGNAIAVFDAAAGEERARFDPEDPLQGFAPDGMVFAPGDSLLFVHYFLGRGVGIYAADDADPDEPFRKAGWMPAIGKEALPPGVLRGKRVFYNAADPRMSLHRYMSCAVCHLDGASDGRVWDFTHKGEGLRRTTSLLGKAGLGRGPLHWTANFDEVQDFEGEIRDGFAGNGFMEDGVFLSGGRDLPLGARKAGLSPDLDALAEYVSSLVQARPSPYRNPDGTLTADAAAGERIFKNPEVGCASCHAPPGYDDSGPAPGPGGPDPGGYMLHDVGTNGNPGAGHRLGDTLAGFDTPTLLGLWESGPYLHDGSAATLMDVITTSNAGDLHGHTSQLSARERDQLVAFLRQIESPPAADPSALRPSAARPAGRFLARPSGQGYALLWIGPSVEGARLSIFDAGGRRLARLEPEPGTGTSGTGTSLTFRWAGPAGRGARPGVFQVRLEWRGGSAARRLVLAR
jgi:YVTN family beta-propeller protein